MPLLKRAEMVKVVQVSHAVDRTELDVVVAHLRLHSADATGVIKVETVAGTADAILKAAEVFEADLIVSGAFGFSRLREWFFGGVTRNFLDRSPVCCLMSH